MCCFVHFWYYFRSILQTDSLRSCHEAKRIYWKSVMTNSSPRRGDDRMCKMQGVRIEKGQGETSRARCLVGDHLPQFVEEAHLERVIVCAVVAVVVVVAAIGARMMSL